MITAIEASPFFDKVPQRIVQWQQEPDQTIALLIPRIKSRLIRRVLGSRIKNPNYFVHLDRFGSYIWERCDGTTTIGQIATTLRETMGPEVEPVFERVALFIQQLKSNEFICFPS